MGAGLLDVGAQVSYTPRPGDIGLTQIRGVTGRAIRLAQWLNGDGYADYEHAFVYLGNGRVVEAQPGGAILAPLSKYDVTRVAWIPASEDHGFKIVSQALALLGTPYSFADYLALFALRLHLPSRRLRAYVASSRHMICSQLADEAWRRAGVELFTDGRPPQSVTPARLALLPGVVAPQ